MLNFILSIVPGLLILVYIYQKDKYEKEPYQYVVYCFLLGIISCIPAILGTLLVEYFMGVNNPIASLDLKVIAIYAFIAVAMSEECAKYIFLRLYIYRQEEFDEPMDGIVYAVSLGMGFAIVENLLYVWDGGWQVALVRMFTAVPSHAIFGIILGYYMGLAKFEPQKNKAFLLHLKGLLGAVFIHGLYDLFLFQNNYAFLAIFASIILIIGAGIARKLVQQHLDNSPYQ